MILFSALVYIVFTLLSIPVVMFFVESLIASLLPLSKPRKISEKVVSSTIIVPAHNESLVIGNTLKNLCAVKAQEDRVIVVADNCDDDTAEIAKRFPVEVIERSNLAQRGKGYALAHGFEAACRQETDVVVIVDADCTLSDNALGQLKSYCIEKASPVQAQYLIQNKHEAKLTSKISEFAFLVKNFVRTRALNYLNVSVPLLGTGMVFPWSVFANMQLASGEIVEDMKLGVDLALDGRRVYFLESALVTSAFPTTDDAISSQKQRWEHGHLDVIQRFVPTLLTESIKQKRLSHALVALDICIPPLAFLVMLVLAAFFIATIFLFIGIKGLIFISLTQLTLISLSVCAVWFLYGRKILSFQELMSVPRYLLEKLPLYFGFFKKRQKEWVKTDRE